MLASAEVRQRAVYFKELAAFLVAERERREWNQTEAADFAKRRGLHGLTRQILLRLEAGQTKSPEPAALQALAALYGLDYGALVERVMAERYSVGRDLLRPGGTGQQDSPLVKGVSDVPATSDRVQELEDRVQAYEAVIASIAELTNALVPEGGTTRAVEAGRRRRDRTNR